jgi:gliding motility-associated-like protein
LVGGEISYTCLGNNDYEIKLRIYRDCAGGGAAFDASVSIAVYDASNNLIKELSANQGPVISISTDSVGNPCVTAPTGLCTEYAEYIVTDNLPPIVGGYTLSWQRCCRNAAIQNIPTPDDYGNTYTVNIPSNDVACNSSPQFVGTAPIVLCVNSPLNLALNVQDPDGDSLHIELCDIFAGGRNTGQNAGCATTAVTPAPACPPPYNVIPFSPPFTSTSPLSANPAFAIDPQTAIITGTPDQLGRYVVGICASEYRNGVLLSTVRLDYQFIVTSCIQKVVSDMVTPIEEPTILCDGLTVQFQSESTNANTFLWNFGDPGTLADSAITAAPTYTYSTPGTYSVTLIAEPYTECSDTVVVEFDIENPIDPQFTFTGQTCFEAQNVLFSTNGAYPADAVFNWNFGFANIPSFTGRNPPPIQWLTPGKKYITLTVSTINCTWIKIDSLDISNLTATIDAGPDQTISKGETVELQASDGIEYYWYANTGVELSSRVTQSTSARLEERDTIIFYVRVKDRFGCEGLDSLTVIVLDGDIEGPINFISPNGDGLNEQFDLKILNPNNDCFISIMNRWGTEVWSANSYQNDWNGIDFGGNELPDGTYYYILRCGNEVRYRSAVTIIRGRD